jgi:hypothetical protein
LVSIIARLRNRRPRTHGSILDRSNGCFIYSVQSNFGVQTTTTTPASPIDWVTGYFSPKLKWRECETDLSAPSSADIKWNVALPLLPSSNFMACRETNLFYQAD